MNRWMQKFFMYLDRYYVKHHSLPTLDSAGLKHFKMLIYNEVRRAATTRRRQTTTAVDGERRGRWERRARERSERCTFRSSWGCSSWEWFSREPARAYAFRSDSST